MKNQAKKSTPRKRARTPAVPAKNCWVEFRLAGSDTWYMDATGCLTAEAARSRAKELYDTNGVADVRWMDPAAHDKRKADGKLPPDPLYPPVEHYRDAGSELPIVGCLSQADVLALRTASQKYGDSWKKRGGCGAYMNLARKWDRIEKAAMDHDWDILAAARQLPGEDGLLDDIGDLRRYLLLIEARIRLDAELRARSRRLGMAGSRVPEGKKQ